MSESVYLATSALGDPTRSEIMMLLMDGRAFPASEIASVVHVSAATASHHLRVLSEAGFVVDSKVGRFRFYRIASDIVAEALEALGGIKCPARRMDTPLSLARRCYNHLAGQLSIKMVGSMERDALIVKSDGRFELTDLGILRLHDLGWTLPSDSKRHGSLCPDWTERLNHIGPPLGTYLLTQLLCEGWLEHTEVQRQLRVTPRGNDMFSRLLGSEFVQS